MSSERQDFKTQDSKELLKKAIESYDKNNFDEAFEIFQQLAKQEDAEAQFYLGKMYSLGQKATQDHTKAVEFYQKSAEQGNASAQNNLGRMYETGQGVEKNDKKAFDWYCKAAEQGLAAAQTNLALKYRNGSGVEQDDAKAFELLRQAAEQGLGEAQLNLALMYSEGQFVEQDDTKAFELYRQAAEQGVNEPLFYLGLMYARGLGVEKNDKKSIEFYRKAADQESKDALNNLTFMYEENRGKPEIIYHIAILSTEKEFKNLTSKQITTIKNEFFELAKKELTQFERKIPEAKVDDPVVTRLLNQFPKDIHKLKQYFPEIFEFYKRFQSHLGTLGASIYVNTPFPRGIQHLIIEEVVPSPLDQMTKSAGLNAIEEEKKMQEAQKSAGTKKGEIAAAAAQDTIDKVESKLDQHSALFAELKRKEDEDLRLKNSDNKDVKDNKNTGVR